MKPVNNLNLTINKTIKTISTYTNPFEDGHENPDMVIFEFTDGSFIRIENIVVKYFKFFEDWVEVVVY